MAFIDMKGQDWGSAPDGGIYLMGHDTSRDQVRRGGGGMMGSQKIRGWAGAKFIPGDVKTSAEAIKLTGLDWQVDRRPIIQVQPIYGAPTKENPDGIIGWEPQTTTGARVNGLANGGYQVAASHLMNVRRDTGRVLGVVGPNWFGPPNMQVCGFMDDLVDSGDAKWLGGGEVDGGRKIWLACQFEREVLLGGDANERSIPLGFITNGWDGGTALTITCAPYRLACLNGQTIPLEGHVRQWRGRHTSGLKADGKLKEARRTLELSIGYFDAWAAAMEPLMTQKISMNDVDRMIHRLVPDPVEKNGKEPTTRMYATVDRKREKIRTIYTGQDDLQHLGGTAYRFLNAVTSYVDWETRVSDDRQVLRSAEPHNLKDHAYALVTA